jgi:hypothetical protein
MKPFRFVEKMTITCHLFDLKYYRDNLYNGIQLSIWDLYFKADSYVLTAERRLPLLGFDSII